MSPLKLRDHQRSAAYQTEMADARRRIDDLLLDGWPLPRLVIRARYMYRTIHRAELIRHRSREAEPV